MTAHDLSALSECKESLRKSALEAYLQEYKELTETWRGLENKAQVSITVAGIFIASTFAYIRDISKTQPYEKVFLCLAVVLLIISVILSILVLRLQRVAPPPLGGFVTYYVKGLVEVTNEVELQQYLRAFFQQHVTRWQSVREQMYKVNRAKAIYLWSAQVLLMTAIIMVGCLTLVRIIR